MLRTLFKVALQKQTARRVGVQSMAGLSLGLHYDAPSPSPFLETITIPPPLRTTLLNSSLLPWSVGLCPDLLDQSLPLMQIPPAGFVCGCARPPPDREAAGTTIKEAS